MEPLTTIFGGVIVAITSGVLGKHIGGNGKVGEDHCDEKRSSCQTLLIEKIENVGEKVDKLAKIVNNKILGI